MAKGTTNWESVETWQRLVASIIATGVKVDLRSAATYFGTTYDTLENRFRKLKKDAAALQTEVDGGGHTAMTTPSRNKSAPATPRKPKTPKKGPLDTVANGRVTKKTPNKKTEVNQEQSGSEASTGIDDMPDVDVDTLFNSSMGHSIGNGVLNDGLEFGGEDFFK